MSANTAPKNIEQFPVPEKKIKQMTARLSALSDQTQAVLLSALPLLGNIEATPDEVERASLLAHQALDNILNISQLSDDLSDLDLEAK